MCPWLASKYQMGYAKIWQRSYQWEVVWSHSMSKGPLADANMTANQSSSKWDEVHALSFVEEAEKAMSGQVLCGQSCGIRGIQAGWQAQGDM